ncbi:peptide chain release factor 1, mitochondrial isoform X2 [Varanus komodoensis]|uniref:peptide chain release factor 1, mitochondrial isoform X2 n=1 Tax=Varanus komodoensis TaxID=61221 RepID=UPI001CF7C608|nr:peptide chain release factor 1, mitochondrial isoform X2 [Varanus komodoensis]
MKPHWQIPLLRTFFANCSCYRPQCRLPFLPKRAVPFVELNISQHSCLWNTVTSTVVFNTWSRKYHQPSKTLWNHKSLEKHLQSLSKEYQRIDQLLNSCSVDESRRKRLSKRHAELFPLAVAFKEIQQAKKEIQDLEILCAKLNIPEEKQLLDLALAEKEDINQTVSALYQKIFQILRPRPKFDDSDVILEVISGRTTGGDICQQFTQEVFDMYQNYAAYKTWSFEIMKYIPADYGGLHHAAARISGEQVYRHLKYEGGTHRVQRIPQVKIQIAPKDLRIDTFRAKGAGGQHVNTTDSAVRIVHIPTGLAVECQQERSQQINREVALQRLREKLFRQAVERELQQEQSARTVQLGTRAQSERIRTYNFSQGRVTDHRISYEIRNIEAFLSGRELLDELISKLLEAAEMEALIEHLENNFKSQQVNS